jgi:hypothetical protein
LSTIHKAGVTIAGLAATLTIAGAFVAQGYVAARQNAPRSTATVQTTAAPTDPAQQTETIYVNPVPSASVVHVVQTAPPLANPPVIHQVVAGGGEPRDDGPGSAGQGDN